MSDLKVEILLPLYYNEDESGIRNEMEGTKFTQTYDDLMDKFGGCTIDDTPLLGGWRDPETNQVMNDENITYWVICENLEENVQFLKGFKDTLKERFQQKDIMIYYLTVNWL